jgi:hypothetical protein
MKSLYDASAGSRGQFGPSIGELDNSINCIFDFSNELEAQSLSLFVIKRNCIIQFLLCYIEKFNNDFLVTRK